MNKHEQISDARRMQLRKCMSELSKETERWSGMDFLDTESTLEILAHHAKGIERMVNAAGEKAGE